MQTFSQADDHHPFTSRAIVSPTMNFEMEPEWPFGPLDVGVEMDFGYAPGKFSRSAPSSARRGLDGSI